jgi:hypothetical protein
MSSENQGFTHDIRNRIPTRITGIIAPRSTHPGTGSRPMQRQHRQLRSAGCIIRASRRSRCWRLPFGAFEERSQPDQQRSEPFRCVQAQGAGRLPQKPIRRPMPIHAAPGALGSRLASGLLHQSQGSTPIHHENTPDSDPSDDVYRPRSLPLTVVSEEARANVESKGSVGRAVKDFQDGRSPRRSWPGPPRES